VGGAMFLGLVIAPMLLGAMNQYLPDGSGRSIPAIIVLSCMALAYAFGEGIGRLACISFGCCYGKPVESLPGWLQPFFEPLSFTFRGPTKKIAYAHGLDGVKVIPIQAITAVIYALAGMIGTWLFLQGAYCAAFLVALIVTQVWRVASEFLRADYRGQKRLSAYQFMAAAAVVIALIMVPMDNTEWEAPRIMDGLTLLWSPIPLLFIQGLWLTVFAYSGRSSVTGAHVSLHVIRERI
jgi:prolipoprotein diacylglyceryltransferase